MAGNQRKQLVFCDIVGVPIPLIQSPVAPDKKTAKTQVARLAVTRLLAAESLS